MRRGISLKIAGRRNNNTLRAVRRRTDEHPTKILRALYILKSLICVGVFFLPSSAHSPSLCCNSHLLLYLKQKRRTFRPSFDVQLPSTRAGSMLVHQPSGASEARRVCTTLLVRSGMSIALAPQTSRMDGLVLPVGLLKVKKHSTAVCSISFHLNPAFALVNPQLLFPRKGRVQGC